ncbi:MAG: YicC/YloC family endoribonuclease [Fermentimonas sp.]
MIHSMTGYGRATVELPNKRITVEIRSLNSKQFDLFTRLPTLYREKEITLRNDLSKRLVRGKVDLSINVEVIAKEVTSHIDPHVIKQYQQELSTLTEEMGISPPADWLPVLMRLPDVMRQEIEELDDAEWKQVKAAIDQAADELIAFRSKEGQMTQELLTEKIENIRTLLNEIEEFETERIEKVRSRLHEELSKLEGVEYDKNRFEQELIYYLEKLDVNEEKARLAHHLEYFLETLSESRSQGKKLGFISQEIGREINTLGSKSNQSDMQRVVVQMKDELEQIKEQILNVL